MSEKAAQELTQFLLRPDPYRKVTPLEERVQRGIAAIADDVAEQVIAENPELRAVIGQRVQAVIRAALADDALLSRIIIDSVAKGLGQLVRERAQEDESEQL